MSRPLKQQVQKHINQVQLNDEQFAELESLMVSEAKNGKQPAIRSRFSLVAASMVFITAMAIFMVSQFSQHGLEDMPKQIAEEVVSNHLKLKPLEVKTGSINTARGYFSKLDFMPVESSLNALSTMQLIGGRYCSLQGITAAQLRMKQGQNLQTLYQTQYLPTVFGPIPQLEKGEAPLIVYARGIKVMIWVEKGVLLAVTDAPVVNEDKE